MEKHLRALLNPKTTPCKPLPKKLEVAGRHCIKLFPEKLRELISAPLIKCVQSSDAHRQRYLEEISVHRISILFVTEFSVLDTELTDTLFTVLTDF